MPLDSTAHGELIPPAQAAELCGGKPKSLAQWRCLRIGPPYCKVGPGIRARVMYPKASLERWRESQLQLRLPAD